MNTTIARGVTLAALTGGLALFGSTSAHAHDLPDLGDLGGVLGADLLDGVDVLADVKAPVTVNGLHVSVLPSDKVHTWGGGILLSSQRTTVSVLAVAGLHDSTVAALVPVTAYNSWVSVLGNPHHGQPSGVVVVPNVSALPAAQVTNALGVVNADAVAPVTVTCTSVSVLSNYKSDCASGSTPGSTEPSPGELPTKALGDLPTEALVDLLGSGEATSPGQSEPTAPAPAVGGGVGVDPAVGGGAAIDTGTQGGAAAQPCTPFTTRTASSSTGGTDGALLGGAALAGGAAALGLLGLARKLHMA